MYKFAVIFALIGCAMAVPAPQPKPGYLAAPLVASPAVAVAHPVPVATSYANTYKVSYKAPVVAAAPVAYAAPAHHAPLVAAHGYHHAPLVAAPALTYAAHAAPIVALH